MELHLPCAFVCVSMHAFFAKGCVVPVDAHLADMSINCGWWGGGTTTLKWIDRFIYLLICFYCLTLEQVYSYIIINGLEFEQLLSLSV